MENPLLQPCVEMRNMVVVGQEWGLKAFSKQWYGLHSPTHVEFTFTSDYYSPYMYYHDGLKS